jgi:DNA-binding GntR family transcriptional regulator
MTVINSDDACRRMAMAILTGELKPRERLVESELIKKFNVKRFTIRKAIQELVHLGFVEFTPNKGARVADITDEELEDLYCVRLSLELLAAELLIKKITPDKLALLWKIHKEYSRAVESGVLEDMVMKNEEFHQAIYAMTENRFLADNLERLKNGIFALRYNAYVSLGIPQVSIAQHEAIIIALAEGDLERLKRCVRENIIYPKMIHEAKKPKQPSAEGAKGFVDGMLREKRETNGKTIDGPTLAGIRST